MPARTYSSARERILDAAERLIVSRGVNQLTVEAVITAGSVMVGSTPAQLRLRQRFAVNLLAVGGRRTSVRLRRVKFRVGDVVVLQGELGRMPDTLAALGCLPLAERRLDLGRPRRAVLPVAILAVAMAAVAFGLVKVEIAFLAAAVAVALLKVLTLQEIYEAIEWPILVLYENFYADYAASTLKILDRLGIEPPPDFAPEPQMRRQSDVINDDWARRFSELRLGT